MVFIETLGSTIPLQRAFIFRKTNYWSITLNQWRFVFILFEAWSILVLPLFLKQLLSLEPQLLLLSNFSGNSKLFINPSK